ncbi:xylose isomerase-like protein [Mycena rosella]|uniref:Xylose isomerase-like protein n=1 Tax=Mycena rosella TaxID=1033263 RepID=A0AAD7DKH5_MYCRO|nr:xylose isomerase-like protein [Mycena rosella]
MPPQIVPAIVTLSLGRPEVGHHLLDKIRAAKRVGFPAIEISYFCLAAYADKAGKSLLEAAQDARALLDELELESVSLGPLMNFEGILDRSLHAEKFKTATAWLDLAHVLRAPLVQLPASMLPSSETSLELGIADLIELTDLAAKYHPPVSILYEFTSWSTHVRTWQDAIQVALKVDRPNFSICLDAFHIGTYLEHANSAQIPASSMPAEQSLAESMAELARTPHASKFTLYQLTDAAPVPNPLPANQPAQDPAAPGLQTMSRTNRPYPFTEGGLLPLLDISRAVLEMQRSATRCIWSMETFVPRAWAEEKGVPDELAAVAWQSWIRMKRELGIQ